MKNVEERLIRAIRRGETINRTNGGFFSCLTSQQYNSLFLHWYFDDTIISQAKPSYLGKSLVTLYNLPLAIVRVDPADECIVTLAAIGVHRYGMTATIKSRLKAIGAWEMSKAHLIDWMDLGKEADKNMKGLQYELF